MSLVFLHIERETSFFLHTIEDAKIKYIPMKLLFQYSKANQSKKKFRKEEFVNEGLVSLSTESKAFPPLHSVSIYSFVGPPNWSLFNLTELVRQYLHNCPSGL